jgi:hypothetical protein
MGIISAQPKNNTKKLHLIIWQIGFCSPNPKNTLENTADWSVTASRLRPSVFYARSERHLCTVRNVLLEEKSKLIPFPRMNHAFNQRTLRRVARTAAARQDAGS